MNEIARRRLQHHRLARPDLSSPAEVVRWFGAVQAQDFLGSLYAIGLRMSLSREALVEQAVAGGSIVRSWPMRGTLHFMAADDARWLVRLLGQRGEGRAASVYRKAGLTAEIIARAGEVFARSLAGLQLTRKELTTALADAGIDPDESRGLHLLGIWARRGLLCLGPRRGKQHTVALLEEWAPPGRDLNGDEALAELTARYFTSHGPATIHDFAWWSGLTIAEARTGVEAAGRRVVQETIEGREYWSGETAPYASGSAPGVLLLPPYDEFTVAYEDRSAFLDPAVLQQVQYGIGPVLLVDGRLTGAWKRILEADRVLITLSSLRQLSETERAAVTGAAQNYGAFIGLPAAVSFISGP